jgi:hypothetical protein
MIRERHAALSPLIDVHKKVLAVVVSDVEIESEYQFERRMFNSNPEQLRSLAAWLVEQEAEEVVMESTAQYWKPVWGTLERYWKPMCEKREGARRKSGTLHHLCRLTVSMLIGVIIALACKSREMLATITVSLVCSIQAVTAFWTFLHGWKDYATLRPVL